MISVGIGLLFLVLSSVSNLSKECYSLLTFKTVGCYIYIYILYYIVPIMGKGRERAELNRERESGDCGRLAGAEIRVYLDIAVYETRLGMKRGAVYLDLYVCMCSFLYYRETRFFCFSVSLFVLCTRDV